MSQSTGPPLPRAPGSFSPVVQQTSSIHRPPLRRGESSSSEELPPPPSLSSKVRPQSQNAPAPPRPFYTQSTKSNSSSTSLQNFSRPTLSQVRTDIGGTPLRNASPLTSVASKSSIGDFRGHGRKHSQTQGSFEAYLPTAATSNLGSMSNLNTGMSASHIAAQSAMQHQQHARQRSQTVPTPQADTSSNSSGSRRPSKGPISPPLLSLTEASAPRDNTFGGQSYSNGLLGGGSSAAQIAANMVFSKSPGSSPALTSTEFEQRNLAHAQAQAKAQAQAQLQAQAQAQAQTEKPAKPEKSKVKLFSRPGKIGISKDKEARCGALPSPNASGASSMYSIANSSSATIRPIDTAQPEKEKDKEKHKHHFLSRQKHKLSSKDEHHLPLSSAASNSKPVDPNAPSSLYNFNLPPSPGPSSTSFAKSMSGLDLRHGGRALREKKKEEKSEILREGELSYQNSNEWPGPSSLGSAGATPYLGSTGSSTIGYPSSLYGVDTSDLGKYGLNNMGADDAWPFLKAKLLNIFEGEDLRLCVEDLNRLVTTHIQRSIQKRCPSIVVEDLRDLLETGFRSLDQTLRRTPDERLIPHLVEVWVFTFTSILPYMQAAFVPLDLEFSGKGPLMSPELAREAWGAILSSQPNPSSEISATQVLEVRKTVLIAFRDTIITPRYETLKGLFSRLSLDSISSSIPNEDARSTSPDSQGRPGTAISLNPSHGSYSSQNTSFLGGGSSVGDPSGSRSRAISNVSYGSEHSASGGGLGISGMPPPPRPFTPSSTHPAVSFGLSARERRQANVEDSSKKLTEMVGRMLQCMSVLSSVGVRSDDDDAQEKIEDLTRGLKLNWLGRGRTGRNRRGLVGGRVGQPAGSNSNL